MNNPILTMLKVQPSRLSNIIATATRFDKAVIPEAELAQWQHETAFLLRQLAVCFRELNNDFTDNLVKKDIKG